MTSGKTNQLLGYSADARLLIINADDFGMCHAITDAIYHALKVGVVHSTTLMVPCPWALYAMRLLKDNADISFGVHLTLICDAPMYRWRPLTSREHVPSLVDETGTFYGSDRMSEFLAQAKLSEVEEEFQAQIDVVLAAGLNPTHLDWHCLHNGGRADIFDLTFGLAKEYGLALRVAGQPFSEQLQSNGLPTNDHDLLDSFRLDASNKSALYAQMLRELPAGLTEWAVHPGFGSIELQAIDPETWNVRQTDYDFMMSSEARDIIQQEGIILLDYKPLQMLWQGSQPEFG